MVRSMTGFGRGENSDNFRQFTVEIKSVNHRYNDIIIKKPKHLNYVEDMVKKLIKSKVNRGRIEVYINLEYINESDTLVKPDVSLAKSYKYALQDICDELNIEKDISIDTLTRFPDIVKIEKKEEDEDEVWLCLKCAVERALEKMIFMRIKEGKELAEDITNRSKKTENIVNEIEARSPKVVLEYKEKLSNRIKEILEDKFEVDENRLTNEVAFFADKSSITEEIVRLYSHLNQLAETLKSDASVGRKLDFLVQEMNREINTIGSKVGDIDITNKVVEIKSELEKIREQIQNIE